MGQDFEIADVWAVNVHAICYYAFELESSGLGGGRYRAQECDCAAYEGKDFYAVGRKDPAPPPAS